jgi:FkbM family methyltransferase
MICEMLTRWLHGLLRRFGLDVQRYHALNFPNLRRQHVLAHHRIDLVLDGGANTGQYAAKLRAHGYEGSIVSFEPSTTAFAQLAANAERDGAWRCRNEALGAYTGHAELLLAANSVSSSVFEATPELLASVPMARASGRERVPIVRLDDVAGELSLDGRAAMLKLDVQGAELDALRGAEASMRRIELIEVEQALVPMYRGAPTLAELFAFLDAHAFRLVSIEPNTLDPRTSHVIEVNALFAREPRPETRTDP